MFSRGEGGEVGWHAAQPSPVTGNFQFDPEKTLSFSNGHAFSAGKLREGFQDIGQGAPQGG